jgi:hypothetical protein
MKKRCRKSGKVKFASHERALTRAGKLLAEPHPGMSRARGFCAYLCSDCGHYHLTTLKIEAKSVLTPRSD